MARDAGIQNDGRGEGELFGRGSPVCGNIFGHDWTCLPFEVQIYLFIVGETPCATLLSAQTWFSRTQACLKTVEFSKEVHGSTEQEDVTSVFCERRWRDTRKSLQLAPLMTMSYTVRATILSTNKLLWPAASQL